MAEVQIILAPQIALFDKRGKILQENLYVQQHSSLSMYCVVKPFSVYNKNLPFWMYNEEKINNSKKLK